LTNIQISYEAPEPIKLDADKVLDVFLHVKLGLCKMDVAALPIKI
jgi:hypothetical protein